MLKWTRNDGEEAGGFRRRGRRWSCHDDRRGGSLDGWNDEFAEARSRHQRLIPAKPSIYGFEPQKDYDEEIDHQDKRKKVDVNCTLYCAPPPR